MQFRLNSQTKKMCSTNRESSSQITSLIWARARILADSRRHYARGTLAPFTNASFVLEDPVDSRLSRERGHLFSPLSTTAYHGSSPISGFHGLWILICW
jgi:hypothetical protein